MVVTPSTIATFRCAHRACGELVKIGERRYACGIPVGHMAITMSFGFGAYWPRLGAALSLGRDLCLRVDSSD